ncbi:MAG: hypothetical protein ACLQVW_17820, partial [Limisphaerales bacterium]
GSGGAALVGAGGTYGGGGATEHVPGQGGAEPPSKGLAGEAGSTIFVKAAKVAHTYGTNL